MGYRPASPPQGHLLTARGGKELLLGGYWAFTHWGMSRRQRLPEKHRHINRCVSVSVRKAAPAWLQAGKLSLKSLAGAEIPTSSVWKMEQDEDLPGRGQPAAAAPARQLAAVQAAKNTQRDKSDQLGHVPAHRL